MYERYAAAVAALSVSNGKYIQNKPNRQVFPGFITICPGSGQQILASAARARLFCVR